jgi:hypothetical protein
MYRLLLGVVLVSLAAGCSARPGGTAGVAAVPACVADQVRGVRKAGSFDPVGVAADELKRREVLAIGEFHRLVGEIRYLTAVIERAAAVGTVFDVGMELLPQVRQADLDALVTASEFEERDYFSLIGSRHDLIPLDVAEYLEIPRAVWTANQTREGDARIRLVGLSPPCTFAEQFGPESVLDCFRQRDATMAEIAEREVLGRGRRLLLSAGRFHAATRWEDEDGEPWTTVAGVLARKRDVGSILLSGPVDWGGLEWRAMCGGIFRSVGAALGRSYAAPMHVFRDLPFSCLGDDAGGDASITAGYTTVVELGPIAEMPAPSPLDGYALSAIGPESLAEWDRFRERLMHKPARGDADGWRVEIARSLVRFTETSEPSVQECPVL